MTTKAEYETIVAANPALKLVTVNKVEDGTEPDGVTVKHKYVFVNPPTNFKLHSDPIEPDNVCILEDLDYVAGA